MDPYRSLCIFIGTNGSLWVLMGRYGSSKSLWVLMDSNGYLWVLIGHYTSFRTLIGGPCASVWTLKGPYGSLCVLIVFDGP